MKTCIIKGPILIADDSDSVQCSLKFNFSGWFPGVEVITATDEASILTLCRYAQPQVIILDADLSDCEGLQLIPEIEKISSQSKIVIFSGHVDAFNVYRASNTSARAFVGKDAAILDLRRAIEFAVGDTDKRVFRSFVAQWVYDRLKDNRSGFVQVLSEREQEVLGELGCGLSNEEIAPGLSLSASTISRHRENLMKKLDLGTHAEMMRYALENGFTRKRKPGPGELRAVPPVTAKKKKYRTFMESFSGLFPK